MPTVRTTQKALIFAILIACQYQYKLCSEQLDGYFLMILVVGLSLAAFSSVQGLFSLICQLQVGLTGPKLPPSERRAHAAPALPGRVMRKLGFAGQPSPYEKSARPLGSHGSETMAPSWTARTASSLGAMRPSRHTGPGAMPRPPRRDRHGEQGIWTTWTFARGRGGILRPAARRGRRRGGGGATGALPLVCSTGDTSALADRGTQCFQSLSNDSSTSWCSCTRFSCILNSCLVNQVRGTTLTPRSSHRRCHNPFHFFFLFKHCTASATETMTTGEEEVEQLLEQLPERLSSSLS